MSRRYWSSEPSSYDDFLWPVAGHAIVEAIYRIRSPSRDQRMRVSQAKLCSEESGA